MTEPGLYDAATALAGENTVKTTHTNNVEFFSDVENPPTLVEIKTKLVELETKYNAQAYARNRKTEYDALNQFEMQFDDEANGTTTWKDAVEAIKTKYPKG